MSYIADAIGVPTLKGHSLGFIFDAMRRGDHPPGYLRCISMYSLDAEVGNGGFSQLFGNGLEVLVPYAVDGFLRIGEEPMASILEEALALWKERSWELTDYRQQTESEEIMSLTELMSLLNDANKTQGEEPRSIYPEGSLLDRLSEIDKRYWDLRTSLQGGEGVYEYLLAPINRYFEEFPDDF